MSEESISLEALEQATVELGASDLHLRVGIPPVLRINGALAPLDVPPITPEQAYDLVFSATPAHLQPLLESHGGADFALPYGEERFRTSVFRERGNYGMVMRLIPSKILSLSEIGLPEEIMSLLWRPRGLILVTGPTGSGKSTTLASMLRVINTKRECHIITIEDPIEYAHNHAKSIVTQREIGQDVPSFAEATRRALRQDPDVILIGELRDLETMQAALTAAETGHLVLASLHTNGAAATINRIVDAFPEIQQAQVRIQLADSLVAVISQQLFRRKDNPNARVAALEVLVATPAVRTHIRDNKTHMINSEIQTGMKHGMIAFDDHLAELYSDGKISWEDLVTKAHDPETLVKKIRRDMAEKR